MTPKRHGELRLNDDGDPDCYAERLGHVSANHDRVWLRPHVRQGIAIAKIDIEKAKGDVIVFAGVCIPWALMQNMTYKVRGHAERLAQQGSLHPKMSVFADWCKRRQSANDALVLGENPMGSIAWQQPPYLRMYRRCYKVKLDQCMFGLRAPDAQDNIKRPTKMLTKSRSAARNLSIRCNDNHSHRTTGKRQLFPERPPDQADP